MTVSLVNGKVIISTEQDLSDYVSDRQRELDSLALQITNLQDRQTAILNGLKELITPTV